MRGRDLASAINELQDRLADEVQLPQGYDYTWAGEFDSLKKEQRRLALIVPASLAAILMLLYVQFRTWRDALIVLATLPFAAIGGILALFATGTPFSISAAVGFTSLTGVATLGAVVFLSGIRRAQREEGFERGLEKGCMDEMRPVVMACMAAGIGLLPAALSNGIGAQAQQPLARVVVGGMIDDGVCDPVFDAADDPAIRLAGGGGVARSQTARTRPYRAGDGKAFRAETAVVLSRRCNDGGSTIAAPRSHWPRGSFSLRRFHVASRQSSSAKTEKRSLSSRL